MVFTSETEVLIRIHILIAYDKHMERAGCFHNGNLMIGAKDDIVTTNKTTA
jgi:hypothetical protein